MRALIVFQVIVCIFLIIVGTAGIIYGTVPILPYINLSAGITLLVGTSILLLKGRKA